MKHLHVGIDPLHLSKALRLIAGTAGYLQHVDGDGWECWGEPVGTDVNDGRTLHVVVLVLTRKEGRVLAGRLYRAGYLTPFASQSQEDSNGAVAVITDAADWGEKVSVHHPRPTKALLTKGHR